MIFLRQIAARDCKWRQGTANGGKGVYTHIADFYRFRGTDYTGIQLLGNFRGSEDSFRMQIPTSLLVKIVKVQRKIRFTPFQ